jgi:hypothetical protein
VRPWTITVRAEDGIEDCVSFEARSRDEALFEAGSWCGRHYSGRWFLVKIDMGWDGLF